jgi:hypothetical protein
VIREKIAVAVNNAQAGGFVRETIHNDCADTESVCAEQKQAVFIRGRIIANSSNLLAFFR